MFKLIENLSYAAQQAAYQQQAAAAQLQQDQYNLYHQNQQFNLPNPIPLQVPPYGYPNTASNYNATSFGQPAQVLPKNESLDTSQRILDANGTNSGLGAQNVGGNLGQNLAGHNLSHQNMGQAQNLGQSQNLGQTQGLGLVGSQAGNLAIQSFGQNLGNQSAGIQNNNNIVKQEKPDQVSLSPHLSNISQVINDATSSRTQLHSIIDKSGSDGKYTIELDNISRNFYMKQFIKVSDLTLLVYFAVLQCLPNSV